jgi:hypothetical protein
MHSLFRLFIPSWRFFDDIGSISRLYYQTDTLPDWQPCFHPQPRRWFYLLLNPTGNLRLACYSLVDRLVEEISHLREENQHLVSQSVSYRLLENLIRYQVRSLSTSSHNFRFKIIVSSPLIENSEYMALLSALHEV